MNSLLNVKGEKAFKISPEVAACTRGIWIYNKPLYDSVNDNYIFLIDTEGLNSLEQNENYDVRVMALTILISSYFIYNSVGNIDEGTISQLALTSKLTKVLQQDKNDKENVGNFFSPKFLWVLRDFVLEI